MFQKILFLALFGAVGTLARYGLGGLVYRYYHGGFPLGTVVVNIVGCFLFGLVWPLAEERMLISGELRTFVLVGFMGAFTTFSSFIFETEQLFRDSQIVPALVNIGFQNIAGLIALYLGLTLSRAL